MKRTRAAVAIAVALVMTGSVSALGAKKATPPPFAVQTVDLPSCDRVFRGPGVSAYMDIYFKKLPGGKLRIQPQLTALGAFLRDPGITWLWNVRVRTAKGEWLGLVTDRPRPYPPYATYDSTLKSVPIKRGRTVVAWWTPIGTFTTGPRKGGTIMPGSRFGAYCMYR